MKALRHSQIREYFFGHGEDALAPSSMTADYADLNIFRVVESEFCLAYITLTLLHYTYQHETKRDKIAEVELMAC